MPREQLDIRPGDTVLLRPIEAWDTASFTVSPQMREFSSVPVVCSECPLTNSRYDFRARIQIPGGNTWLYCYQWVQSIVREGRMIWHRGGSSPFTQRSRSPLCLIGKLLDAEQKVKEQVHA